MVHLATAEDRIREVWATNLEDEFKEICKVGNRLIDEESLFVFVN